MIGKNEVLDRSGEPPNLPDVILVEITVLRDADAPSLLERIASGHKVARWPAVLAPALLVAILATTLTPFGDHDGGRRVVRAAARESGPAGVAAAYGYPLRCLRITILAAGQRYARAEFDPGTPCGRFTGYPTAIFLRVLGVWRPVIRVGQRLARATTGPRERGRTGSLQSPDRSPIVALGGSRFLQAP